MTQSTWCKIPIFLLILFACAISISAEEGSPPNIILIMTDDQGYGDFGFTGNPVIRTPNLDRMAAESAQMTQFYVSPVCAPTRASLMTGRYNYRTRAIDTWNGHARMDPAEWTVAERLREAGYATGLFGKWHLGDNYPMRPEDQGFEEVLMHRGGGIGQPSDPDGAEGKYTDPILIHNGQRVSMQGYCTDLYFDRALSWITENHQAQRPFFAYIATNAPHGPFHDVPVKLYDAYRKMDLRNERFPEPSEHRLPKEKDTDKRARVYAMITNIDENIGRLLQGLDELEIGNETLVIFLVDNGPNGNRYVAGFKGMKGQIHEGGIRSPLLLRWPGRLNPEARSDRISAHIDITPTILEACNVSPREDDQMDGKSLLPLLENGTVDWPDRTIVIQAHRGSSPSPFHNFAIRSQRWKLLHNSGFGNETFSGAPNFELFDMVQDPYAEKDLAAQRTEVVERLRLEYLEWFTDVTVTRADNYLAPRIVVGSRFEDPVVLTRQDGEHFKGAPFRRESIGIWKLNVPEPGRFAVRFRFNPAVEAGRATLKVQGQTLSREVAAGDTSVRFEDVALASGPIDLLPLLSIRDKIFSPWKIDIGRESRDAPQWADK